MSEAKQLNVHLSRQENTAYTLVVNNRRMHFAVADKEASASKLY